MCLSRAAYKAGKTSRLKSRNSSWHWWSCGFTVSTKIINTDDTCLTRKTLGECVCRPPAKKLTLSQIVILTYSIVYTGSSNIMIHNIVIGCFMIKAHCRVLSEYFKLIDSWLSQNYSADGSIQRSRSEPVVPFCRVPKTGTQR